MSNREIFITQFDLDRLRALIGEVEAFGTRDSLTGLGIELQRATVVSSEEIPPNVVTMNSQVVLRDVDSAEEIELSLVFPDDADPANDAISILAPVGTAILGYAEGDVVEWPVPSGVRRLRIERIVYQPEAAGDMHL